MKPKIAETVPPQVWQVFGQICQVIDELPPLIETPAFFFGHKMDPDTAISHMIPSCHVVARSLMPFFPVIVHDGLVSHFDRFDKNRNWQHSWLTVKECDGKFIIDPWPLGVVSGPAIFIQDYAFYFVEEPLPHLFGEDVACQVESTTREVRKVVERIFPQQLAQAA